MTRDSGTVSFITFLKCTLLGNNAVFTGRSNCNNKSAVTKLNLNVWSPSVTGSVLSGGVTLEVAEVKISGNDIGTVRLWSSVETSKAVSKHWMATINTKTRFNTQKWGRCCCRVTSFILGTTVVLYNSTSYSSLLQIQSGLLRGLTFQTLLGSGGQISWANLLMKELDDGEGEALVVRHDEGGSDLTAQWHPAGKHQLTTVITCRPTEQEYPSFRYANTKFASILSNVIGLAPRQKQKTK